MSNNTTSICNLSESFKLGKIYLYIFSSTVLPTLYILLGTVINAVALLFFKRQLKDNDAYGYQIAAVGCKLLEMFSTVSYNLFWNFAGGGPVGGLGFFKSSYALMWFTLRVVYTGQSAAGSLIVMIPTAISVDRALAMAKPLLHQTLNHRWHQVAATMICLFLSTVATVESAYDYDPKESSAGVYSIVYNAAHAKTYWKVISLNFRTVARYIALVVLVASSATLVYKYRKRNAVGAQLFQAADKMQLERQANERALFALVIVQCAVAFTYTTWINAVAAAVTYFPAFFACEGSILPTVHAVVTQLAGTADYALMLLFSKKFRSVMFKSLKSVPKMICRG